MRHAVLEFTIVVDDDWSDAESDALHQDVTAHLAGRGVEVSGSGFGWLLFGPEPARESDPWHGESTAARDQLGWGSDAA